MLACDQAWDSWFEMELGVTNIILKLLTEMTKFRRENESTGKLLFGIDWHLTTGKSLAGVSYANKLKMGVLWEFV